MATPIQTPTLRSIRPLLMLLLFFAVWSERSSLQLIAEAASSAMAGLDAACGDPNR